MWNLRAKVKHKSAVTASAGCRYLGGDSVSYSLKKNPSWEAKSQDINRYLQNPKVHYSIHKSLPPFPILSSSSRACKHLNFSLWGVVNTSPNPQTGGPPLASRPLLLIQYIRSYPPNLEAIPLSAIWSTAMPSWQGSSNDGLWRWTKCNNDIILMAADVSILYINKIQQDATVCMYLFTAKSLYIFRVSIAPIIRST